MASYTAGLTGPSTEVHFTGLVPYFRNRSSFVKSSNKGLKFTTISIGRRFGFNCLFVCLLQIFEKVGESQSQTNFYGLVGPMALNHTLKMVVIWQGFKGPYARQVTESVLHSYIRSESAYCPGFFVK
jgi:hypothetical protein